MSARTAEMFPSVPSTPLFLGALFICASAHLITGCQNIDLYAGVLDPSLELQRYSPHQLTGGLSTRISPCTCCALCHHRPTCQSVSYDPASSECILYSTVGTLRQLTRNQSNQHPLHFFLPRHSQTDQFCLRNSDCIMPGDLCRAHICTPELTVTCRHLFNMARRLSSARHWTHINGTDVITECYRNRSDGGYTLLLNSVSGYQWTREDRLRRIKTDDEGRPMVRQQYSILWLADAIRDSSENQEYDVYLIFTTKETPGRGGANVTERVAMTFRAPKHLSLISHEPTPQELYSMTTTMELQFEHSFPYLTERGGNLYHINADATSGLGALIRGNKAPLTMQFGEIHSVRLYIRE